MPTSAPSRNCWPFPSEETMTRYFRLLLALALVAVTSLPAAADDKDFLRPESARVPPNLLIVFGNSQTMTQTMSFTGVNFSTFDGDADSPGSKLGAGKNVIRQFVSDFHTTYDIGLTAFSRPPNFGSTDVFRNARAVGPLRGRPLHEQDRSRLFRSLCRSHQPDRRVRERNSNGAVLRPEPD